MGEDRDNKAAHDPLLWGILAGILVWIIFDNLVFGLIAGVIAFSVSKKKIEHEEN